MPNNDLNQAPNPPPDVLFGLLLLPDPEPDPDEFEFEFDEPLLSLDSVASTREITCRSDSEQAMESHLSLIFFLV